MPDLTNQLSTALVERQSTDLVPHEPKPPIAKIVITPMDDDTPVPKGKKSIFRAFMKWLGFKAKEGAELAGDFGQAKLAQEKAKTVILVQDGIQKEIQNKGLVRKLDQDDELADAELFKKFDDIKDPQVKELAILNFINQRPKLAQQWKEHLEFKKKLEIERGTQLQIKMVPAKITIKKKKSQNKGKKKLEGDKCKGKGDK